jgi:serine/threonine protein kinase
MEFLAQTLRQFLNEQRGPVPIATRASIAAGIVSGMLFLHLHKSVAHMDLKSHNIL